MAHAVIMPALGMAQDTGVIVSWLKRPGEAVKAGEPLMEVETDKAVMEVEAAHDGWLADVRVAAGAEAPVGSVIAMIVADPPAADLAPQPPPEPPPAPPAAVAPPVAPAPAASPAAPPELPAARANGAAAPAGRVLASPKARAMAAAEGLDLSRLAAQGHPQPFHIADLARLRAAPAPAAAPNRAAATARAGAFAAFKALLHAEIDPPPAGAALWAAFAAGALRDHRDGSLAVAVEAGPGHAAVHYVDPDQVPLAEVLPATGPLRPALTIRDLTEGPLTELTLARDDGPVLAIAGGGEDFRLTLAWPDGALTEAAALALLFGMAARIEQPLRHLL